MRSEVFFKVYIPIFACQFCDPKSDSLYGLITKDISYNRPYASGQLHVGYLHKVQISKKILILLLIIKSLMRKTSYLHAGVERENFKIDCHILFGVGPADIMHVDNTSLLQCVYARVADAGCPSLSGWP